MSINLTNKSQLIEYLKEYNLWAKKGLSQNFLIDKKALDKIVEAAELKEDDFVVEIGPGAGTLTQELVSRAGEVVAVEMDEALAKLLGQQFKIYTILDPRLRGDDGMAVNLKGQNNTACRSHENGNPETMQANQLYGSRISSSQSGMTAHGGLTIINADILKVNLNDIIGAKPYKVVANIPYHITSKILELFLSREHKPELIVLLVQKEVAERVCAKPGQMSVLALSVQLYGKPEIVGIVPKESFFPSPKVDSAILRIEITKPKLQISNKNQNDKNPNSSDLDIRISDAPTERDFFRLVHIGFAAKRKTLVNNLIVGYQLEREQVVDILKEIGLKETVRAQELSIEEWKGLAGKISNF